MQIKFITQENNMNIREKTAGNFNASLQMLTKFKAHGLLQLNIGLC